MDNQLTFGEQLRDEGMAASQANAHSAIVRFVDAAIDRELMLCGGEGFTAEDVRARLDLLEHSATVSKVIGARMHAASRRGVMFTKGETRKATRPDAHARRLLVWYRKPFLEEYAA
jgi:hypothetical protein